jgi:Zn-dependent protease
MSNILSLRFPGWDPERTLKLLLPVVGWLFQPTAVFIQVVLIAASWLLLSIQFDHFRRLLPEFQQFFGWPNLLWLYFTLAFTKILHELGHGVSCRYFGGECHEIGDRNWGGGNVGRVGAGLAGAVRVVVLCPRNVPPPLPQRIFRLDHHHSHLQSEPVDAV